MLSGATVVYFPFPFAQIQGKSDRLSVSNGERETHNHRMAKQRKRTIRLIRRTQEDGAGAFCIQVGDEKTFYAFGEIPCEIGGRGFAVHRLGLGELYHVRIGTHEECSCECKGFLRHGYCRHVLGLLALIKNGMLP